MELRLSAHRASNEQGARAARDLDSKRRRYRRRRDGAEPRARRLERELAGDATGHEQNETVERASVEDGRPDHLVDCVMAPDVFRVMKKPLAVGERRGVDAARVLVALAAREQLLEQCA